MELAIRMNRSAEEMSCGNCGDSFIPHRGPTLFAVGDDRPVCRSCGRKHAPDLADLLALADAARKFVRTEDYQGTNP